MYHYALQKAVPAMCAAQAFPKRRSCPEIPPRNPRARFLTHDHNLEIPITPPDMDEREAKKAMLPEGLLASLVEAGWSHSECATIFTQASGLAEIEMVHTKMTKAACSLPRQESQNPQFPQGEGMLKGHGGYGGKGSLDAYAEGKGKGEGGYEDHGDGFHEDWAAGSGGGGTAPHVADWAAGGSGGPAATGGAAATAEDKGDDEDDAWSAEPPPGELCAWHTDPECSKRGCTLWADVRYRSKKHRYWLCKNCCNIQETAVERQRAQQTKQPQKEEAQPQSWEGSSSTWSQWGNSGWDSNDWRS